jgi:hypothetical protein
MRSPYSWLSIGFWIVSQIAAQYKDKEYLYLFGKGIDIHGDSFAAHDRLIGKIKTA